MRKILLTTVLAYAVMAGSVAADDFSRSDIEAIIKEYIEKNPEVILDSVESYGRQQRDASQEERQKAVDDNIGAILEDKSLPIAGNPNGDVTVIEFFDYNCGYCKKALTDITTLIEEDQNVKVVFVELPILGRMSEVSSRWALAAQKQDAYLEYHIGLMQNRGGLNESALENIAQKIGLDVVKMRKDAESAEVSDIISQKAAKANSMGISGTPAFIINGKLYGGYIGLDAMRRAVKEARED